MIGEMWQVEDAAIRNHFKDLAEELRDNHRAMLAQGGRAVSENIHNAALHHCTPRATPYSHGDPTNEAFAQTLPLLDPKIEAVEVFIDRMAARR